MENSLENIAGLVVPQFLNLLPRDIMDGIVQFGRMSSSVIKIQEGQSDPACPAPEGFRVKGKDIHVSWLAPDKGRYTVTSIICPGI